MRYKIKQWLAGLLSIVMFLSLLRVTAITENVTPAEEIKIEQVQVIDELPDADTITAGNRADVQAQIDTINGTMPDFTEDEAAALDTILQTLDDPTGDNGAEVNAYPAPKPGTVEQVQTLIDALPDADTITAENRIDIQAQIDVIDEAMLDLTEDEAAALNTARYDAAVAALSALDVQTVDPDPGPSAEPDTGPTALEQVQTLIDALPNADTIIAENRADVQAQIDAIGAAMLGLTGDQAALNTTRYDAAVAALSALDVQTVDPDPGPSAEPDARPTALEQVQALIDALPDAEMITADNRADVEAQLTAINEVKLGLGDEEVGALNTTRYDAAVVALFALDNQTADPDPEPNAGPTALEQVQALIDALPDAEMITADNRADVEAQLMAINEVKLGLSDEEVGALNTTRYDAAVAALFALDNQTADPDPEPNMGPSALEQVQALIDGLPDTESITADNRADVEAQLAAIDEARRALEDEELDALDITRYMAAMEAILALDDMAGADEPMTMDFPGGLSGEGTAESPYQISTKEQLEQLSEYVNNGNKCNDTYFKLMGDIELDGSEGSQWVPIGDSDNAFYGTFDGGGHTISGLYIDNSEDKYRDVGLFGEIGSGGTVKNLGVSGYINGGSENTGGIAGENSGTITGCHSACTISSGEYAGGIVGQNRGTVSDCYNIGSVSGDRAGGIVGRNYGTVSNCYNVGSISGENAGGISGWNAKNITNCYNVGTVTGSGSLGGIAGTNDNNSITNCYNFGTVTGSGSLGGVVGTNAGNGLSSITNCYFLAETADTAIGAGTNIGTIDNVAQKSADEFKSLAKTLGTGWTDDPFLGRPVRDTNKEPSPVAGEGTSEHPFEIPDKETLELVRDYINDSTDGGKEEFFKLTGNINLEGGAGNPWTPIGSSSGPFQGTFDGSSFTVSGLSVTSGDFVGLFGSIGDNGSVKNLGVSGSVTGQDNVGGIAGQNKGTIENCHNTATVTGNSSVGGIVGSNGEGTVTNCYNTGAVTGSPAGGIVGSNGEGTVTNCYYLSDTATSGSGEATEKSADQFASGEVAYLLQKGQNAPEPQVWGQTVGSGTPELTNETGKKVYKVTFATVNNEEYDAKYANYNGNVELPTEPTLDDGTVFDHWSTTNSPSNDAKFDGTTAVTRDITVYAVGVKTFGGDEEEIALTTTYGEKLTKDLSKHVAYKSGTSTTEKFEYEITSGNDLLNATIEDDILSIPETANAGDYTLIIKATEKVPQYSLMSVNTYGTDPVTLRVKVTINKAASEVKNIPIAAEGLTYTGAEQELVKAGTPVGGTMQYSLDGENYSTDIPKGTDAKEYTVWYKVVGDENHSDSEPQSFTVTIGKATPAVTVRAVTGTYGDDIMLTAQVTAGDVAANLINGTIEFKAGDTTLDTTNVQNGTATLTVPGANRDKQHALFGINGSSDVSAAYTGNDNINNGDGNNTATVSQRTLKYTVTADGREYIPGSTGVTVQLTPTDFIEGDEVTLTAAGNLSAADAAAYESVSLTEITIDGKDKSYYTAAGTANDVPLTSPVTVSKADSKVETIPAAAKDLIYTGAEQELVTAGTAAGGTMQYSLDGESYSTDIPKGTAAKKYTVWYKVAGDGNHNDTIPQSVTATIGRATSAVTVQFVTGSYGGDITLTAQVTGTGVDASLVTGTMQFADGDTALGTADVRNGTATLTVPGSEREKQHALFGTDGSSSVTAAYSGNDNINSGSGSGTAAISQRALEYDVTATGREYEPGRTEVEVSLKPKNLIGGDEVTLMAAGNLSAADAAAYGSVNLTKITIDGRDKAYYTAAGAADNVTLTAPVTISQIRAKVETPPTGKTGLVYTGGPLNLLTGGAVSNGGTMQYYVSKKDRTGQPDETADWKEDISDITAADAGTYTIWYRANGNINYVTSDPGSITVVIAKAESFVTRTPAPGNRTYDGADHPLVEAGAAEGGTIQYSLEQNGAYSETIPNSQGAGEYTVWYKVVGDANHNDSEPQSISVTIGKSEADVTGKKVTVTYGESVTLKVKVAVKAANGIMLTSAGQNQVGFSFPKGDTITADVQKTSDENETASVTIPPEEVKNYFNPGSNEVTVSYGGSGNLEPKESVKITVKVKRKALDFTFTADDRTYNGSSVVTGALKRTTDLVGNDNVTAGLEEGAATAASADAGTQDVTVDTDKIGLDGSDAEYYKAGNVTGGTVTISRAPISDVTAPAADSRTYDGTENALVTLSVEPDLGTMQYALGDGTADDGNYSGTIPRKMDAGTYYVWYYVKGDDNHSDSTKGCVSVTIGQKPVTLTWKGYEDLIYTGSPVDVTADFADGEIVNGDEDDVTVSVTGGDETEANSGETYTATASLGGSRAGNYTLTNNTQTYTIGRAEAKVETPPTGETGLTYTGDPLNLLAGGAVSTGGTMQYYVGGKDSTGQPDETADWKEDISDITAAGAGTYTIWYRVVGDGNHNDSEPQSITVTIEKAEGTGSLTMADFTCKEAGVEPMASSGTNGPDAVITYAVTGTEDFTAQKPETAGFYTVKAVFPANQNYNELPLTADFRITHQFNAGWEHRDDGDYHLCACGVGLLLETKELAGVPEVLKQNPNTDTVEKIERVLTEKVDTGERYVIYDAELQALIDGEWVVVTPENLPEDGVSITIPYPEGTSARYSFTVVHMFTTAGDGHVPGDTEILEVTNEPDGIHFMVTSLSPIAIGWKAGSLTVTVTDTGEDAGPAQQWQFRVELDDKTLSGEYGDMRFTDGAAEFTLQSGQSLTAQNLPEGAAYTVTELNGNQNGYTTTCTDDRGTITSEQNMTAAFINDKLAPVQPDNPPDDPSDNPPDTPSDDPDNPPDIPSKATPTVTVQAVTGTYGEDITLTAQVTAGDAAANLISGTIEFKDGDTTLGTAAVQNGTATLTVPGTDRDKQHALFGTDGSSNVTAAYSGNDNISDGNGSSTAAISQRALEYDITAVNREYEPGKTEVEVSLKPKNLIEGDEVTLTAAGNLSAADAAAYESVSLTEITIDGRDKAYYTAAGTDDDVTLTLPVAISQIKAKVETPPAGETGLVYTGDPLNLLTGEAASNGGTMQYYVGEKDRTEQPDETADWKEDISDITAADAGTYTIWYRANGNTNYAASDLGSISVTIEKADGTGTLTMADFTCKEAGIEPRASSGTNGPDAVITYAAAGTEDFTNQKPETAGFYTVKAVFPANQNYNELTLTADFKITHLFNAGLEHRDDGDYHLCACGVELLLETKKLSGVPEGLRQNPDTDTVEKIERILAEKVDTGDHYVIYNVEPGTLIDGEWVAATPENLPEEGVSITIPYPEGTSARYSFTVVHMFTTAGDGHVPGDTEILKATNETDGIHFTVKSFSPIAIGWKAGSLTVTVTDTGEDSVPAQQWQFRVELDDKTISGEFGGMRFTDGAAEFMLQSGQSLTAQNLPEGAAYTVTELNGNQNGYTTTCTDDRGIITSEQDMTAAFINDKPAPAQPDNPPDDPADNPPDTPSDDSDNPPDTPSDDLDNPPDILSDDLDNPPDILSDDPDNPPDILSDNEPGDSPQTGDESHLALWFSLMILSLICITVIVLTPIIGRKKLGSTNGRHMRK